MTVEEFEEQLYRNVSIVEVVREYIPTLHKTGRNYKALCPFHKEKTPSFIVSPEKNIFHCFGCDRGGGVVKFVELIENIPKYKAMEKLSLRYKINIKNIKTSQETETEKVNYQLREKLYKICAIAADFYHNYLMDSTDGKEARQYLSERKLNKDSIYKFKLGLAPKDGDYILKMLSDEGFSEDDVRRAGLATYSEKYNKYTAYFYNRIIFPIRNINGEIVGFGGRTLKNDDSVPKYINTAETEIYSKRKTLYGLYESAKYITENRSVLIVEGYMDVIILHQEGIKNTVSPLGTGLTEEQIYTLRRYSDEVILSFDSDEGGISATLRAIEMLLTTNIRPKVISLPNNVDPDEIILSKGKNCFIEEYINTANDGIIFLVKVLEHKNSSLGIPWAKSAIIKEMIPVINKIKDKILRNEWIKWLSEYFSIDEQIMLSEFYKKNKKVYSNGYDYDGNVNVEDEKKEKFTLEEEVLSILLNNSALRKDILANISPQDFSTPLTKTFAEKIFNILHITEDITYPKLVRLLNNNDYNNNDENKKYIPFLNRLLLYELPERQQKLKLVEFKNYIIKKRKKEEYSTLCRDIVKILDGEQPYDIDKINKFKHSLKETKCNKNKTVNPDRKDRVFTG